MSSEKPLVALFKREWLPGSETFIRQQQDSIAQFRTLAVGARRIESSLSRSTDLLVFENAKFSSIRYKIFSALGRSAAMTHLLSALNPAVVHAHFASEGMTIRPIAKRLNIPLVVTLHGYDITAAPRTPGLRGLRYRTRLRRLFSDASQIIAVSGFIRQQAIDFGCPPEKISICYIGTNTDTSKVRSHTVLDTPQWDILFVGRLVEKKGVTDLLRAVQIAQQRLESRIQVCIVGSGPEQDSLERLSRELNVDAVFMGALVPKQVRETMRLSKIFCAPSKTASSGDAEGFGMVFLEAALSGLPVLSYRHGGVPEAVVDGETALLADENDYQALAENMIFLMTSPETARQLGQAGQRRVQEQFDIRQCTKALERVYAHAIRR